MWNLLELPKPGDDPWVEADGMDYAAVGCGVGGFEYVLGYRRAVDALYEALRARDWFSPMVRPYLFLWRHYIELHLKRLYYLGKGQAAAPRHGLLDLWHEVKPLIPIPEARRDQLRDAFVGMDHVLELLELVDANSTDSRYHEDRRGGRSLQNAPKHLNVEAFHDVMCRAANLLDCVGPLLEFRFELAASG